MVGGQRYDDEAFYLCTHPLPPTGAQVLLAVGIGALIAVALVSADYTLFANKHKPPNGSSSPAKPTFASRLWKEGLGALPTELRIIVCGGGIYTCYLLYGFVQEDIYKYKSPTGEKFRATLFLLFVQYVVNALFALICMVTSGRSNQVIPVKLFAMSGFTYTLAMLFSNEALKHVSYPVQALGKSCKMVPVMLMGLLFGGKKRTTVEIVSVFVVTAGITLFQSGKKKGPDKDSSMFGIGLLLLSLLMDGLTGMVQDNLKKVGKPTVHEFMFFTNLSGVAISTILGFASGDIPKGYDFCLHHPEVLHNVLVFSLLSAFGQNFIFLTLKYFDALVLTTVTTTRKFFTVLASIFFKGNRIESAQQWVAIALVAFGLSGEIYEKYEKQSHGKKKAASSSITNGHGSNKSHKVE